VTKIVAATGDGNDTIEVDAGVDAVLEFDGGQGSDTFLVSQFQPGSRFAGGSGSGYDTLRVSGASTAYVLATDGSDRVIAPAAKPADLSRLVAIDSVTFDDRSFGAPVQQDTRASSGPVINGDVHLALRSYAGSELVGNLDLLPDGTEPTTGTDSRGEFSFGDAALAAADRNGDGATDWRDGMVVVGSRTDNAVGTVISVIDSISGSDMGFPLVGLPGHNATLLTTLKYAGLLRWKPGMNVGGAEVTPALINTLYSSIIKDVPSTFTDDTFSEYVALGSTDPETVALGTAQLRFNYAQLVNILTVIETFRQLGLDFSNEAAWGYRPDPTRADQLEIVAFNAYGYALATRFGASPLDYQGRPAVAAQFDAQNPTHVRALLAEILANYPTERLLSLAPEIAADFVVDSVRTSEQQARIEAAIEQHLGGFLDNLADGIVLSQKTLERRINDSVALSDLVPQLGQQLFVPAIAGSKRVFIDSLARELVSLAALPDYDYRAEFYPLFFAPKAVDAAGRATSGSIGVSIVGATPSQPTAITLAPDSTGKVRLRLDLFDALGGLAAPDSGLAVRFRVGGTARGVGDYTLSTGGVLNVATFQPGSRSTTIDIDVSAAAIADGSRYLQIEILGADSGYRVDGTAAVATIAFGEAGRAAATTATGGRTDFVPHELVTRPAGDDTPVRAPGGGDHPVLRGIDGEADLFVIGDEQASGVPFIENFRFDDGDRIAVFTGGVLAARRAAWLADPARRSAALAAVRTTLGANVVDRLPPAILADLIDNQIEADDPLPEFKVSQINTYGGIVFDVTGQRPLAYVSDYSQAAGDSAWSTLSTNITAGIFSFGDLGLTAKTLPENTAAGTTVGEFSNAIPIAAGDTTFEFAAGTGADDNGLFDIVSDDTGPFRQSFLVARGPFDYETNSRLSIRVRATDSAGLTFERVFTLAVTNVKDAPGVSLPESFTAHEDMPTTLVFPTAPLVAFDTAATTPVSVVLRVDSGALRAASAAGVTVTGSGRSITFTGSIAALNRYFTDPAGRVRYRPAANATGAVGLRVSVAQQTRVSVLRSSAATTIAVTPVNDAPTVRTPVAFRVVEDVAGRISWAAVGVPFADVDSGHLTVTLSVPDGKIDAASAAGVDVGGTATARTFSGSTAALNAFFRSLGQISYTTAPDNTAPRVLQTTVSDGTATTTATSVLRITPVNDAPTLAASGLLTGATAGRPFTISHAMLEAATGARDDGPAPLTFRIQSIEAGRIEKWNGRRWVRVIVGRPLSPLERAYGSAVPTIGPEDRIRWVPPQGSSGTVAAFTVRVFDGEFVSATASRVSIALG
jgi:hypothetical protein